MRLPPGLIVIVIGLVLLAAGVWSRWGWEIAALAIGGLMVSIGVFTLPGEAP